MFSRHHKVLLLDTNFSAEPMRRWLEQAGYQVSIAGGRPNDALAKETPGYLQVDYSDLNALEDVIDRLKPDFLIPGCNDLSYSMAARVNYNGRFPGLDTPDQVANINDKARYRRLGAALGLPMPAVYENDLPQIAQPVLVKPVDAFSGKGIFALSEPSPAQLEQAIASARAASPSGQVLVEDQCPGELYSHSAFIQQGQVINDFIVKEYGSANPWVVDTSALDRDFPETLRQRLRTAIEILVHTQGLNDGLLHTQFLRDEETLWLIESTRRCPGDLYSELIRLSTGFDYVGHYLRPFLGLPISAQLPELLPCFIMRHTLSLSHAAVLASLRFFEPLIVERWIPLALTGDRIAPSPTSRIAILFARCSDAASLAALIDMTRKRKLYELQ